MIGTKITAIKEYLYVRSTHRLQPARHLSSNFFLSLSLSFFLYDISSNLCLDVFLLFVLIERVEIWRICRIWRQGGNIFSFGFQNFARTHSPTRLMSSENTYSLSREHANLKFTGEFTFQINFWFLRFSRNPEIRSFSACWYFIAFDAVRANKLCGMRFHISNMKIKFERISDLSRFEKFAFRDCKGIRIRGLILLI